ncbi:helix-turn-helix domain-containing protein [Nocardia sp. NPDC003963]
MSDTTAVPSTADPGVSAVDPLQTLATRVRTLREIRGISQRRLARQIMYSHTIVHRVENSIWPVSRNSVQKIGEGLDATAAEMDEWLALWESAFVIHSVLLPVTETNRTSREGLRPEQLQFLETLQKGHPHSVVTLGSALSPQRPRGYRQQLYLPVADNIQTVGRYVDALRQLRASVDYPSYRDIAARAAAASIAMDGYSVGKLPAHTTLHDLFKPGRVELRWEVVLIFLAGCGLSADEVHHWHKIFQRLHHRPRAKFIRQIDEYSPPPAIDLNGVTAAFEFVDKMRELARASGRSMEKVLATAKQHRGTYLPCRSAVFARFRDAEQSNILVERNVVVGFLRGCYCRTQQGYRCVPDCKADLIEPWMRVYDSLHGRKRDLYDPPGLPRISRATEDLNARLHETR